MTPKLSLPEYTSPSEKASHSLSLSFSLDCAISLVFRYYQACDGQCLRSMKLIGWQILLSISSNSMPYVASSIASSIFVQTTAKLMLKNQLFYRKYLVLLGNCFTKQYVNRVNNWIVFCWSWICELARVSWCPLNLKGANFICCSTYLLNLMRIWFNLITQRLRNQPSLPATDRSTKFACAINVWRKFVSKSMKLRGVTLN